MLERIRPGKKEQDVSAINMVDSDSISSGEGKKIVSAEKRVDRSLRTAATVMAIAAIAVFGANGSRFSQAFFSGVDSKVASSAATEPIPQPNAMTVYEVTNPNTFPITVTANITDTLGFNDFEPPQTVGPCTIQQFHLRDMQNVPSPLVGAMTISSNDGPFTGDIAGYDYPGVTPDLTSRLAELVYFLDPNGGGKVTVAAIQWVAGRWNSNVCDTTGAYDKSADLINNKTGEPYSDGKINITDVQLAAGYWNEIISPPATATPVPAGSLKSFVKSAEAAEKEVDLHLEAPKTPISAGQPFTVEVKADNVEDLGAFEFGVKYDPSVMKFIGNQLGSDVSLTGRNFIPLNARVEGDDVIIGDYSLGTTAGVNGNLQLGVITFQALVGGVNSNLMLDKAFIAKRLGEVLNVKDMTSDDVTLSPYEFRVLLPNVSRAAPKR